MKWAAILFMQIRWSKIKTQLRNSVLRSLHSLFVLRRMCAICYVYSLKVVNIVKLEAILFMQIRWSKRQNSAWEPGKSNSAYPKYAKKSCSQLLLRNASRKIHMNCDSGKLYQHTLHNITAFNAFIVSVIHTLQIYCKLRYH